MDAGTDELREYQRQLMVDREERQRDLDQYARRGGCPNCGREGGLYHDTWGDVLWYLGEYDDAGYEQFPYYRQTSHDASLVTACAFCHPAGLGDIDGYTRLTWRQAQLHALRQRRLERRVSDG